MNATFRARPSQGPGCKGFSRRRVYLLTACLLVSAVSLAAIVKATSEPHPVTGGSGQVADGGPPSLTGNEPLLLGGRKTTLASAEKAAGYAVELPVSPAAEQRNLTQIWVNRLRDVALAFDGGRVVVTMSPATYRNPAEYFQSFIRQNGRSAKAGIRQVGGRPALVIMPDTDSAKSNPAWVEFDNNGIDTNIYSQRDGTGTLLSIARSM
jgi:hypothetical protein